MDLDSLLAENPFCRKLGVKYPIAQAGMFQVAHGRLAGAVSAAGGLGVIGSAFMSGEELRREIGVAREMTDNPLGVDILFARIKAEDGQAAAYAEQVREHIEVTLSEDVQVLVSGLGQPDGGKSCWGSGFLPTLYQGVEFRSQGDPVLFTSNPPGVTSEARRSSLDAIRDLNEMQLQAVGDPEISTCINAFEMAYRMQTSVPEIADIWSEPSHIHEMYGTEKGKVSFANNCLLARRLIERGVRFLQLYHRGWDSHGTSKKDDILHGLPHRCRQTDQAAAALVMDLKQRGLLDDTIVIWGGEFGRTPMNEGRNNSVFLGRDHHPRAFTMWMAGGGFKPGVTIGATDELGYNVVEDKIHVHDLHATMLHLMGLDHTRLTYRYQGRDFRLTDVAGKVVDKLLA